MTRRYLSEVSGGIFRCEDLQTRIDVLFGKNMEIEGKAREAELEKKRAVAAQDDLKDEINMLQRNLKDKQTECAELEDVALSLRRQQVR
jgi:uncharacterized tellurite resistance protein B-like protein